MSQRELERMTRRYTAEVMLLIGPDLDIPAPDLGRTSRPWRGSWTPTHDQGRTGPGSRDGQAAPRRRLGGPSGGDGPRPRLRHQPGGAGSAARLKDAASPSRATGTSAPSWHTSCGGRARRSSPWPMPRGGGQYPGLDIGHCGITPEKPTRWPGSRAESPWRADDLLELPCDVLVPGRPRGPDHVEERRPHPRKNVARGPPTGPPPRGRRHPRRARGARHPRHPRQRWRRGVSYFEWVQGLQYYFWRESEINSRLQELIIRAFNQVLTLARRDGVDLRTAALMLESGASPTASKFGASTP